MQPRPLLAVEPLAVATLADVVAPLAVAVAPLAVASVAVAPLAVAVASVEAEAAFGASAVVVVVAGSVVLATESAAQLLPHFGPHFAEKSKFNYRACNNDFFSAFI